MKPTIFDLGGDMTADDESVQGCLTIVHDFHFNLGMEEKDQMRKEQIWQHYLILSRI